MEREPPPGPSRPPLCAICQQPIRQPAERRTIRYASQEFAAHGSCLFLLRRLLHHALGTPPPTPTLIRSPTLSEFLLIKRPRNPPEILACLAYHLQHQAGHPVPLTPSSIREHLRYTPYKIPNISAALHQAAENLDYLKHHPQTSTYHLTQRGASLVEHLPSTENRRQGKPSNADPTPD